MQSGRLLITGLLVTGCATFVAGCSGTSAKKSRQASTEQVAAASEVRHEYIIKNAPVTTPVQRAMPLPSPAEAKKQRLQEQLRAKYHRQWEEKQKLAAKRAEYRRQWEQQQAQKQAEQQANKQRRLVAAAAAEREQALAAAQRQRYQQQWQARQQQAQARQQQVRVSQQRATPQRVGYGGRGVGSYSAASLSGDFAGNSQLLRFIDKVSARHGFSKAYLYGIFSQTRNRDDVARLWAGNNGGSSSGSGWYNYRSKFVTPANVQKGEKFWRQYAPHLLRASRTYGVEPEYIVGIMGVETRWGRIFGRHRVIDALTTSAIVNKRRSDFFFSELENYLLMTRSERMDPLEPKGSYAGAMGYGQFMPSSFRSYAVDFDGDGIRDLWNPVDAIGSIANYFTKHGWKYGQEVVVPAKVTSMAYTEMPDGYKVKYSPGSLAKKGIRPRNGDWSNTGRTHLLALTTVPGGIKEPWIGYHNFYVITRYNHSNYYAMAVHQLAKAVQSKVGAGQYASR